MAANPIDISALVPVVPVAGDLLQQIADLADYGTDANDVILDDAEAAVLNALPLNPAQPILQYDNNRMPWNKNPLDRIVPVPLPANATFTNRNKLLKMLKLFILPAAERPTVTFQVSRVGTTVYYLDGPLGDRPGPEMGPYGPMQGEKRGFGIPFEERVSTNATPNLEKFFVLLSYSLLGTTQLLVRNEIDCKDHAGALTEIKTKKEGDDDVDYYKSVWWQMFFGCTQTLVRGLYVPIPGNPRGRARFTITTHTFAQVAVLAQIDVAVITPQLAGLASLIEWIRSHIADGETKTFAFAAATQECSMV